MPNNKYLRSRRREWALVADLRKQGYIAVRSAGSHSLYDVWAFHPEKKHCVFVQIKTEKNGRKLVISDEKEYKDVKVETWQENWTHS